MYRGVPSISPVWVRRASQLGFAIPKSRTLASDPESPAAGKNTIAVLMSLLGQATAAQRTTDLENLIATIGVASDPKAIAEMQARIGAQQALVSNENAKLQSLAYLQAYEQQQNDQRANEVVAKWGKDTLPAISF